MTQQNPTSLGGPNREFPATRWTLIQDAGVTDRPRSREALDQLCRLYWKPVYAYIRSARSLGNDSVKDLTQEFFLELVEGGMLARFAPGKGSFRGYLKGALQLFLRERHRSDQALKRGGGRKLLSLQDEELRLVEQLADRGGKTPEEIFDRQWANSLLEQAVQALRTELTSSGREVWFAVFEQYDVRRDGVGNLTYAELARTHGIKETDVTNYLNHCRRRLRELMLHCVKDYVSFEGEVSVELAELFPRT